MLCSGIKNARRWREHERSVGSRNTSRRRVLLPTSWVLSSLPCMLYHRTKHCFGFFICYPAVRTGSSNTHFFSVVFFFWWSLAPDLRFSLCQRNTRRVFRYTAKGPILSDRNIFYTPRGENNDGVNASGVFLVNKWFTHMLVLFGFKVWKCKSGRCVKNYNIVISARASH